MENTRGFTLPELLVTMAIMGILAAVAVPSLLFTNKAVGNAVDQAAGIFKQSRSNAIATTSVYLVKPGTSTSQLIVQSARARVCSASTQLSSAAASTDIVLHVVSATGFGVGDSVTVGSSTANSVIATNPVNNTITLGQSLGSSQSLNATVNLSIQWGNASSFSNDELTLPQGVQMFPINWMICFNSRGIATQYDSSGNLSSNQELQLTLKDPNGKSGTVQVLSGGGVL